MIETIMADSPPDLEADSIIELYKRDVDVSLLAENLRLSPQQRLEKLAQMQQFAAELRRAGQAAKSSYE
jgi:hypothetical protein